ncbi:hypothetical protein [Blastopirellula marina]|uniref:Tetratricopeptide repeat protein n=1 Tax=Blastopirellula marina TaxID=124 RepID=A0A2S8G683_9BACT|nr:hypothetical protein [Blastopirellula marina]PQO39975.1 hypothetical protein C5Y98_06555 [Blastopirellula marina]PTL45350.1 hypothetical protein C5Y97_06555 [Blastopirellula marina]
MNDSLRERINQLWREAYHLPFGEVKVRVLEESLALTESLRDVDAIFIARLQLAAAGTASGHPEKAIPAYAWCLARFEEDPQRFQQHEHHLLWFFKNILHSVDEFPRLTLEQIEDLRTQMTSIYRRFGRNMRPVHYTRFVFSLRIGDLRQAAESLELYSAIPRDELADCLACEADSEAEYYAFIGDMEKTLATAGPNLRQERTCAEVPHRIYCQVLKPLALLGRYEEADEYQRKGYRLIRNNPTFLYHIAFQIAYLVHRNRLTSAVRMFEQHLATAIETHQLRSRFYFYAAAQHLLTQVAQKKSSQKLNLPQAFPLYSDSQEYDLATLIAWLDAELGALGPQFDARNRTNYFTQEIAAQLVY